MSAAIFKFCRVSPDSFAFYDSDIYQFDFKHATFRPAFEDYALSTGRGSKWVGSMLRIYLKTFPPFVFPLNKEVTVDNLFEFYTESSLVGYLRSRGFRVVRKLSVSDRTIIEALERQGYIVEGLLENDVLYSSLKFGVTNESTG